MTQKTICYLVAHGFSARMLLHSQLTHHFRDAGYKLVMLVADSAVNSFSNIDESLIKLESVKSQKTHLLMSLTDARRYLKEPIRENAALWSRHLYWSNGMGGKLAKYRAKLNYVAHRILFRCRPLHKVFNWIDHWAHSDKAMRDKLKEIAPDVIVSTYPVAQLETTALLEAKKLNIRTVGHLLSWDNITCKGLFSVVPDHFVTWGPIMDEELSEFYGVEPARKHACGVPHFDAHLELVDQEFNQDVLTELGLDPNKPYLFFGMSAPIFSPHEIDLVEWFAKEIERGTFGDDMQLIVRPHPQNVTGNMADDSWLPRLQKLPSDRVALNYPRLTDQGLSWNMATEDLKVLVNLLAGSSVCFNSGSTLSIDALAHNKPVIVTLFDADRTDLPWWKSARRIHEYPHYKKLLAMGGVVPVNDFDELITETKAFLSEPDRLIDQRTETLRRECTAVSGSCQRVVQAFDKILGQSR